MKLKAIEIIKGVVYTFFSNAISLIVTAVAITIVPKVMGIDQYGYYQLFIFYSSNIVPFLHFGWINGIYLRYGGMEYKELDKNKFYSQYWMLTIFEIIIAVIIYFCVKIFIKDINKLFILEVMAIRTLIVIPREMLLIILQGTNRLKEYSSSLIIEKIVFSSSAFIFSSANEPG